MYSAQALCSSAALTLTVTVPANAGATVRVPFNPALGTNVTVSEGGAIVWANGAFAPNAPSGILSASLSAVTSTVDVVVGGGLYAFVSTQ